MGEYCTYGHEINDCTEFCPNCGENIRAERAERKIIILEEAIKGWKRMVENVDIEKLEQQYSPLRSVSATTIVDLCAEIRRLRAELLGQAQVYEKTRHGAAMISLKVKSYD